jgi:hypothetical protein
MIARASKRVTICEKVRELNDLHQGDSEFDQLVRQKLAEIEYMAKRMVRKLAEYKASYKSDVFPELNTDRKQDIIRRKNKNYKTENYEIQNNEMD